MNLIVWDFLDALLIFRTINMRFLSAAHMAALGRGEGRWRPLHRLPQESTLPSSHQESVFIAFGEWVFSSWMIL